MPVLTPARLRSITASVVAAAFVVGTGAVVFLSRPDPPADLGTAVVVVPGTRPLEPTTAPTDPAATPPAEAAPHEPPVANPAPAPGPVAPAPGGRVDDDDDDDRDDD